MYQPDSLRLEWIEKAAIGDRDCLQRLAEAVNRRIGPYIGRVIVDVDLRADLTQETLVRVLSSLTRLRDPGRFWPWVYAIAGNATRQHLRTCRRRREMPFSTLDSQWLENQPAREGHTDPPTVVSGKETRALTRRAMNRLHKRYRDVLLLRCLQGKSYEEIAVILGCQNVTARALMFRAKKALRRELTGMTGVPSEAQKNPACVYCRGSSHTAA